MQQSIATRLLGERGAKLLTTRRGTVLLGAAAALLAAILLIVYLNRYRSSLNENAQPTPVLVADRLIAKGTSVSIIGNEGLFQLETIPREHIKDGAVADPEALRGRVALHDIYPGTQLTLADFSTTTTNALPTRITGDQRAIAVSVDAAHGLVGEVGAGDHVDVYVGLDANVGGVSVPVITLLYPNVMVLSAPGGVATGIGASNNQPRFVLRVRTDQVPKLAYAADHGTLWLVARPANGAKPTLNQTAVAQSLLFGKRIQVGR